MAKGGFGNLAALQDNLALLALRLPLGIIFIAHGSQKLIGPQKLFGVIGGQGLTATLKMFEEQMGIPPVFTLLAILAEFGGGIGLVTGFLTRLSAVGIAIDMIVAIRKVHLVNGFFLNMACAPGKGHGFEYNLALLGMALALALRGGGKWALDRMVWRG